MIVIIRVFKQLTLQIHNTKAKISRLLLKLVIVLHLPSCLTRSPYMILKKSHLHKATSENGVKKIRCATLYYDDFWSSFYSTGEYRAKRRDCSFCPSQIIFHQNIVATINFIPQQDCQYRFYFLRLKGRPFDRK